MTGALDAPLLLRSLCSSPTIAVLVVSALVGVTGALTRALSTQGWVVPRRVGVVLVGAVAGIAVVAALPPDDALAWIALALVGGYSGKVVLDVLAARIEQAVTVERAAEVARLGRRLSAEANALVDENDPAQAAHEGLVPVAMAARRLATIRALRDSLDELTMRGRMQ